MSRCIHHGKFSILGFLTLFALYTNAGMAESSSRFGAFTNCVDANGDAFLCTQNSWGLALGYSASKLGDSAFLIMGSLNPKQQELECSQAPTPASLAIRLSKPDLRPADRIYLEDFIIEAFKVYPIGWSRGRAR